MLKSIKHYLHKPYPMEVIGLIVTLYISVTFNQSCFEILLEDNQGSLLKQLFFEISSYIFLFSIIYIFTTLFLFNKTAKFWLITLILCSTASSYFMKNYGTIIDKHMIQNIFETDPDEAFELFNMHLFFSFLKYALIPILLISKVTISKQNILSSLKKKFILISICLLSISFIAMNYFQSYASIFRNNHQLKSLIVPIGPMYSVYSYTRDLIKGENDVLKKIGQDAHLGKKWNNSSKPVISILVLGETARADNFSLGSYPRITNPLLIQENITYFPNVASCGTSTAVSLPCMFSRGGKKSSGESSVKHTENILDVIQHAGFKVIWLDNNTGCKDLCKRTEYKSYSNSTDLKYCKNNNCYDEVLLNDLDKLVAESSKPILLVIHQKGSHGPAYYQRTPIKFHQFQPICHTNLLQACSREKITNAYDNSILYTDYFLTKTIHWLKNKSDKYDTSLLYVSDHGESLGENGMYLHGMPEFIAPSQQTHVPMIVWTSNNYAKRFNIDKNCLEKNRNNAVSHDNLFDSLLGMLDINTTIYKPELDILTTCKSN